MDAMVAIASSPECAAAEPGTIGIRATADALPIVQRTAALTAVNASHLAFAAAEVVIRGITTAGDAYHPHQARRNAVSVTIWILVRIAASQHQPI